ncbi:integral membrane protein [Metarhizium anisopliae]
MDDIRNDLPLAMTMAAFIGISWYIGIEINAALFLIFKRRRGLYFWSCALTSWGVILQPLFIILADFGVWKDPVPSITLIYLSWFIMVVPQSWVLYSRLHLLMHTANVLRGIKYVLIFNSIVFSIPTMVIGTIAQATSINPNLPAFNLIWDRIQLVVFFVQEAALSILYMFQTRKYLRGRAPLTEQAWSSSSAGPAARPQQTKEQKAVLWQLVYANALILALDVVLLGIQCANMFHLQGAFKPCVYGIKLKLEFVILNRLIQTIRKPASTALYLGTGPDSSLRSRQSRHNSLWHKKPAAAVLEPHEDNDAVQLVDNLSATAFASRSRESQAPAAYPGGIR